MKNNKFSIDCSFEIKELLEEDGYFYFTGYGSTKDLDLVNDIVEPAAFNESLKNKMPVMLWQHNRNEPIGVYIEATPDDKGLKVRGKMPLDDDFVRGRVVPQLKAGSIDALSIGFRTLKADIDHEKGIRIIREAELLEISLVTFPANPEARISQLKALEEWARGTDDNKAVNTRASLPKNFTDKAYRWDSGAAEKRVRAWAGATEGPNAKYKSAFLWYDSEDAENFTAYKLQVVDIVDGSAVIVPRAVFAVRAALAGARGGVDIPAEDKTKIQGVLNALYTDMELDPPFEGGKEKAYCKTEILNLQTGVLFDVLRYKTLSRDAADFVLKAVETASRGYTTEEAESFNAFIDRLKSFNEVK